MQSKAATVKEYLDQLPEDRRKAIMAIRKVIKANLGKGFQEGMQYGMIGYFVPFSVFPAGYHCKGDQPLPFASLGSQKNHMAFYSFFLYQDGKELERFQKAWKASGHKLDMGKSCIRFKKLEDVPLDVLGETVKRQDCKSYIANYEKVLGANGKPKSAKKKAAKKKATKKASKKAPAKKATAKKAAKKAVAKKSTAKKATKKKVTKKATKKAPIRKVGAKKTRVKKAPARKKPAGTKKKSTRR